MKVGVPAQESEVFSFLQRSLFASFLKDTLTPKPEHETTEPGDIEDTANESLEEVKIISSEDSKLESNLLEQSRISQLDTNQIVEIYGGMFVNYYYEMFLPDLLSSEIENIFLYPDIDEKVKEISERRIHIASCQLYLTTKFVHFMTWFVSLVTANIPERKSKLHILFIDIIKFTYCFKLKINYVDSYDTISICLMAGCTWKFFLFNLLPISSTHTCLCTCTQTFMIMFLKLFLLLLLLHIVCCCCCFLLLLLSPLLLLLLLWLWLWVWVLLVWSLFPVCVISLGGVIAGTVARCCSWQLPVWLSLLLVMLLVVFVVVVLVVPVVVPIEYEYHVR